MCKNHRSTDSWPHFWRVGTLTSFSHAPNIWKLSLSSIWSILQQRPPQLQFSVSFQQQPGRRRLLFTAAVVENYHQKKNLSITPMIIVILAPSSGWRFWLMDWRHAYLDPKTIIIAIFLTTTILLDANFEQPTHTSFDISATISVIYGRNVGL